jgi:hypothetical protein
MESMDNLAKDPNAEMGTNTPAGNSGSELVQPIAVTQPEPGHELKDVLTLENFIALLKEEEDYWSGEQNNTKLMITRLRKIFYDEWGWNSELIRGAAKIDCRYVVEIIDDPTETTTEVRRFKKNQYQPKHRLVTYRPDDRVYGNTRVGQSPFIYINDHQEIVLPDGTYCDAGHILAGLDAYNYPQIVTPLPNYLHILEHIGPHVDSNMDVVTWLGDIASSAGDFLFDYLRNGKKPESLEKEQQYINADAPGSDMLGNIEPYILAKLYNVGSSNGLRYTEILEDYYFGTIQNPPKRVHRYSLFCEIVGLKGWDGTTFSNEKEWLKHYKKQLRDNVCFQVMSLAEHNLKSVWMVLKIWMNGYSDVLKLEELLEIFLNGMKAQIKKEPHN